MGSRTIVSLQLAMTFLLLSCTFGYGYITRQQPQHYALLEGNAHATLVIQAYSKHHLLFAAGLVFPHYCTSETVLTPALNTLPTDHCTRA